MYPMCHSVSHAPKCSHSPTENKYPTRLGLVSKNWSGKGLFLVGEKFAIPHWIERHVSFYTGYGSLICSNGLQSDAGLFCFDVKIGVASALRLSHGC